MDIGSWQEPITFETPHLGRYRTIGSAAEAARVLLEDWPVDGGEAYIRAKAACLSAMTGTGTAEDARAAFICAAEEVDVFIRT